MLDYILGNGLKGALLGAGIGLLGLPIAYYFVQLSDNPKKNIVASNFIVNGMFLIGFLFFGAMSALPYAFDEFLNSTTQHAFALSLIGLSMACGVCLFDARKRSITWDENIFILNRWNECEMRYEWRQIDAIEWDSFLHIWRIELKNGDTFAFHPMMTGANRFLEMAKERARLFTEGKYSQELNQ